MQRFIFFTLPAINSFVSCFAVSTRHFAVLLVSQLTAKLGRRVSHGLPQAKPWRIQTSSEGHESPIWEVIKNCSEK